MNSTKDNWIKALKEILKKDNLIGYGTYEAGHEVYEKALVEIKSFISQVEKDAIEKTNKRWRAKIEKMKTNDILDLYWKENNITSNLYAEGYLRALSDLIENKK